jgi:hypothetical protein
VNLEGLGLIFALLGAVGCKAPDETRFLNFDTESTPEYLLKSGWSFFERDVESNTYIWVTGKRAMLDVTSRADGDRLVRFRGMPFVYPKAPPQSVKVILNDRDLANIKPSEGFRIYSVFAPHTVWRRGNNVMTFEFGYAESPQATMQTNDLRPLSFAFDWLEIEPVLHEPAKTH